MTCDSCGSDNVRVSIEPVKPHGNRAVFTCQECETVWINTDPSAVEQVVVAFLSRPSR